MVTTRIDITKYVKSGEGANGESYNSIEDKNEMLKLYNAGYDTSDIETEMDVAKKVYDNGFPVPKPGELITDGERIGIRFWRIPNKTSFARAIGDNPDMVEELTRKFARMCRHFHTIECKEGVFTDAKEQFLQLLEYDTVFNKEEKKKIADFIRATPDTVTAVHGDMHVGNAVMSGDFKTDYDSCNLYWIDLGFFAVGNPLFDLGMMYIICVVNDDDFIYENMHFHKETAEKVWEYFVSEYFDGKLTLQEADELIKPYAAIKTLLIERNLGGVLFPHFENLFRTTILK